MDKYLFYIKFAGEEVSVSPLNTNKIRFETKLEDGQVFYRRKMLGRIKFYKQDFDYLYAIELSVERCQVFGLRVEKLCGGEYSDYWEGTFSLNDGRFDLDNCTFEVGAQVKDKYNCILDNKKKPVNILELSTVVSTQANLSPIGLEYSKVCIGSLVVAHRIVTTTPAPGSGLSHYVGIVPDVTETETPIAGEYVNDCVIEEDGWQVYKVVYRDPVDAGGGAKSFTVETTFFREILETFDVSGAPSIPPGDGWVNAESSTLNGLATTIWVRKPFGGTEETYTTSYQSTKIESEYTSSARKFSTIKEVKFTNETNFIYDKCRYFKDAVWYVANKYCGTVPGVISDFFQVNADGTAPDNEAYQKAIANLSLLTISQKSDVLRPTPISPKDVPVPVNPRHHLMNQQTDNQTKTIEGATKGLMTWEQMEEVLKNMFNVYWDIDDTTGAIRLEHLSYWAAIGVFDLTISKYYENMKGSNRYEYEKATMPQLEKFEFMERSFDIDFLGFPIEYKSICVNQEAGSNEALFQVSQVTTDLNLIFAIKESISKDGFVIFQNYIDTEDDDLMKVFVDTGYISGSPGVNKHLSWGNLHYNYHRWGRVMSSGVMNNFPTEFSSYTKTKRQDLIKITLCCDDTLNPKSFFVTGLSNKGELKSMVHNIFDDTIELTIYHPADGTNESPISRQFDDSFDLSFK